MKRFVRWFLSNAALAICLWLWFMRGIAGAHYVVTFYVWVGFLISLLLLSPELTARLRKSFKPVMPVWIWIDVLFDIAVTLVLVWNGQMLLGSLYLVHFLLLAKVHSPVKEEKAAHA